MPDGSLSIRYSDPLGIYEPAVSVSLGSNVRFGRLGLANSAELGQSDISTVEIDDPGGILNVVGLRAIQFKETAAPSNNQIVLRGVIQDRIYRRSEERSLITGADRLIVTDVADYNWHLGARRFTDSDADRPAETPGDRIRWLLSSAAHITLFDYGNVTYPSSPTLEANDYRGQTPLELLADCAIEGQYNFWCDYNEANGRPELFFIDPDSSEYQSNLYVSNVLDDVDNELVFAPSEDAELRRSPTRLTFGALVPWGTGGWVYERKDSTGQQFAKVDQVAPMRNVKSSARARRLAQKFLAKNDEESDRLTFSIKVPAATVNEVRHGQLLPVRFSHFPGYEDWRMVRVLKRGVVQEEEGGEDYYRILIEAVDVDVTTSGPPPQPGEGENAVAALYSPNDRDPDTDVKTAGTLWWGAPAYDPPSGYPYIAPSPWFDYIADRSAWTTIESNGSGYCTVWTRFTSVGVWTAGTTTMTVTLHAGSNSIQQVQSKTADGLFGVTWSWYLELTDVPITPGDLIYVEWDISRLGYPTIPAGAGNTGFKLYVSGTMS